MWTIRLPANRVACRGKRFAFPTALPFAHKLHSPQVIFIYSSKQNIQGYGGGKKISPRSSGGPSSGSCRGQLQVLCGLLARGGRSGVDRGFSDVSHLLAGLGQGIVGLVGGGQGRLGGGEREFRTGRGGLGGLVER